LGYSIKNTNQNCPKCNCLNETLVHVFFECKRYSNDREIFMNSLKKATKFKCYDKLSKQEKIISILDLSSESILRDMQQSICKFIKAIDTIRQI